LEGIWKVRDKTNQIPFSFMVLRNGNFALVGDEQGEIKYGTFRHAPQNDHPAEIDLVLADNGKLITDLGYYQVSQPKPEKNPIAFFWFSNSGTTRPLLHTECEEQYEMEQVDTQIFRQSPVTSEMSQAWEIWQRLGNPSYSPASKPSPAAGLNSPTPTTPNQKANDESAVTAAEVALSQQNHGEEESAQDADQISHLIDPANVPLDGIWKFTTPNRFLGGFLVITNGQFAIVSGPKDEGELEGIWRYNSLTAPPIFDLEFTSGGPPDPQLGVYKLMQFHHHRSTKNSDGTHNLTPIATLQLTVAFGQPGKPRPTKIDGRADQLTLIQIDLSQVTGEQDLPDRLPVEVWRKWKTMTEPGTKSPMDDE
jgi:hypothetical protein